MINIVTALKCEALPFIKAFCLKMRNTGEPYRIYSSDSVRLIITGTGGVAAACGTTYLLATGTAGSGDTLINCGCCGLIEGHGDEKGRMYLMRSIKDEAFNKYFYPDMIGSSPFPEADLISMPYVNKRSIVSGREVPLLADMEGAYVFQAASRYIKADRILILKAVSDSGEDLSDIKPKDVEELITAYIGEMYEMIENHRSQRQVAPVPIDQPIDLMLSEYQRIELNKLAAAYSVRHDDLDLIIEEFSKYEVCNRREGKSVYAKLKAKLLEP